MNSNPDLLNLQQYASPANPVSCATDADCQDQDEFWCCSQQQCSSQDICLFGTKLPHDACESNWECFSKCCSGNQCADQQVCQKTCQVNNDCIETEASNGVYQEAPCCSWNRCVMEDICNRMKEPSDYCDFNDEC